MKLTLRNEYTLLALVYLARRKTMGYVFVETIAKTEYPAEISRSAHARVQARQVCEKCQGATRRIVPDEIGESNLARQSHSPFRRHTCSDRIGKPLLYEATPIEKEKRLIKVFRDIRDYAADKMESTTIADVI